jgi:hypothetical protein
MTKVYMQYLANWAQVLPWQEVARRFHTSWEKVFSVEYVVEWGLKHRSLEGITVGVDEIAWKKGRSGLPDQQRSRQAPVDRQRPNRKNVSWIF